MKLFLKYTVILTAAFFLSPLKPAYAQDPKQFPDHTIEIDRIAKATQVIQQKIDQYGSKNVWVVWDIDHTLLRMPTDLGTAYWFAWQINLINTNSNSPYKLANSLPELLSVQSQIFNAIPMEPVEATTVGVFKRIFELGTPTFYLTARPNAHRTSTEKELARNGFDFSNFLPSHQHQSEWLNQINDQLRDVNWDHGLVMSSEMDLDKGRFLRALTDAAKNEKPKCLIVLDDNPRMHGLVDRSFKGSGVDVIPVLYTYDQARAKAFDEAKQQESLMELKELVKKSKPQVTQNGLFIELKKWLSNLLDPSVKKQIRNAKQKGSHVVASVHTQDIDTLLNYLDLIELIKDENRSTSISKQTRKETIQKIAVAILSLQQETQELYLKKLSQKLTFWEKTFIATGLSSITPTPIKLKNNGPERWYESSKEKKLYSYMEKNKFHEFADLMLDESFTISEKANMKMLSLATYKAVVEHEYRYLSTMSLMGRNNMNAVDEMGRSPLVIAVVFGDDWAVKAFLDNKELDLNIRSPKSFKIGAHYFSPLSASIATEKEMLAALSEIYTNGVNGSEAFNRYGELDFQTLKAIQHINYGRHLHENILNMLMSDPRINLAYIIKGQFDFETGTAIERFDKKNSPDYPYVHEKETEINEYDARRIATLRSGKPGKVATVHIVDVDSKHLLLDPLYEKPTKETLNQETVKEFETVVKAHSDETKPSTSISEPSKGWGRNTFINRVVADLTARAVNILFISKETRSFYPHLFPKGRMPKNGSYVSKDTKVDFEKAAQEFLNLSTIMSTTDQYVRFAKLLQDYRPSEFKSPEYVFDRKIMTEAFEHLLNPYEPHLNLFQKVSDFLTIKNKTARSEALQLLVMISDENKNEYSQIATRYAIESEYVHSNHRLREILPYLNDTAQENIKFILDAHDGLPKLLAGNYETKELLASARQKVLKEAIQGNHINLVNYLTLDHEIQPAINDEFYRIVGQYSAGDKKVSFDMLRTLRDHVSPNALEESLVFVDIPGPDATRTSDIEHLINGTDVSLSEARRELRVESVKISDDKIIEYLDGLNDVQRKVLNSLLFNLRFEPISQSTRRILRDDLRHLFQKMVMVHESGTAASQIKESFVKAFFMEIVADHQVPRSRTTVINAILKKAVSADVMLLGKSNSGNIASKPWYTRWKEGLVNFWNTKIQPSTRSIAEVKPSKSKPKVRTVPYVDSNPTPSSQVSDEVKRANTQFVVDARNGDYYGILESLNDKSITVGSKERAIYQAYTQMHFELLPLLTQTDDGKQYAAKELDRLVTEYGHSSQPTELLKIQALRNNVYQDEVDRILKNHASIHPKAKDLLLMPKQTALAKAETLEGTIAREVAHTNRITYSPSANGYDPNFSLTDYIQQYSVQEKTSNEIEVATAPVVIEETLTLPEEGPLEIKEATPTELKINHVKNDLNVININRIRLSDASFNKIMRDELHIKKQGELTRAEIEFINTYIKSRNLYVGERGRNTFLHEAATKGYHPKIVVMLVNHGFSMNAHNNSGYTPLALWIGSFKQSITQKPERKEAFYQAIRNLKNTHKLNPNVAHYPERISFAEYAGARILDRAERKPILRALDIYDQNYTNELIEMLKQSDQTGQPMDYNKILNLVENGLDIFDSYFEKGYEREISQLAKMLLQFEKEYIPEGKLEATRDLVGKIILNAFEKHPTPENTDTRNHELVIINRAKIGFHQDAYVDDGYYRHKHEFKIMSDIFYHYLMLNPDQLPKDDKILKQFIYMSREMDRLKLEKCLRRITNLSDAAQKKIYNYFSNEIDTWNNTYNRTLINNAIYAEVSVDVLRTMFQNGADFTIQNDHYDAHDDDHNIKEAFGNNHHIDSIIQYAYRIKDKQNAKAVLKFLMDEVGLEPRHRMKANFLHDFAVSMREIGFTEAEVEDYANRFHQKQFGSEINYAELHEKMSKELKFAYQKGEFRSRGESQTEFAQKIRRAEAKKLLVEKSAEITDEQIKEFVQEILSSDTKRPVFEKILKSLGIEHKEDFSEMNDAKIKAFYREGVFTHLYDKPKTTAKKTMFLAFFEHASESLGKKIKDAKAFKESMSEAASENVLIFGHEEPKLPGENELRDLCASGKSLTRFKELLKFYYNDQVVLAEALEALTMRYATQNRTRLEMLQTLFEVSGISMATVDKVLIERAEAHPEHLPSSDIMDVLKRHMSSTALGNVQFVIAASKGDIKTIRTSKNIQLDVKRAALSDAVNNHRFDVVHALAGEEGMGQVLKEKLVLEMSHSAYEDNFKMVDVLTRYMKARDILSALEDPKAITHMSGEMHEQLLDVVDRKNREGLAYSDHEIFDFIQENTKNSKKSAIWNEMNELLHINELTEKGDPRVKIYYQLGIQAHRTYTLSESEMRNADHTVTNEKVDKLQSLKKWVLSAFAEELRGSDGKQYAANSKKYKELFSQAISKDVLIFGEPSKAVVQHKREIQMTTYDFNHDGYRRRYWYEPDYVYKRYLRPFLQSISDKFYMSEDRLNEKFIQAAVDVDVKTLKKYLHDPRLSDMSVRRAFLLQSRNAWYFIETGDLKNYPQKRFYLQDRFKNQSDRGISIVSWKYAHTGEWSKVYNVLRDDSRIQPADYEVIIGDQDIEYVDINTVKDVLQKGDFNWRFLQQAIENKRGNLHGKLIEHAMLIRGYGAKPDYDMPVFAEITDYVLDILKSDVKSPIWSELIQALQIQKIREQNPADTRVKDFYQKSLFVHTNGNHSETTPTYYKVELVKELYKWISENFKTEIAQYNSSKKDNAAFRKLIDLGASKEVLIWGSSPEKNTEIALKPKVYFKGRLLEPTEFERLLADANNPAYNGAPKIKHDNVLKVMMRQINKKPYSSLQIQNYVDNILLNSKQMPVWNELLEVTGINKLWYTEGLRVTMFRQFSLYVHNNGNTNIKGDGISHDKVQLLQAFREWMKLAFAEEIKRNGGEERFNKAFAKAISDDVRIYGEREGASIAGSESNFDTPEKIKKWLDEYNRTHAEKIEFMGARGNLWTAKAVREGGPSGLAVIKVLNAAGLDPYEYLFREQTIENAPLSSSHPQRQVMEFIREILNNPVKEPVWEKLLYALEIDEEKHGSGDKKAELFFQYGLDAHLAGKPKTPKFYRWILQNFGEEIDQYNKLEKNPNAFRELFNEAASEEVKIFGAKKAVAKVDPVQEWAEKIRLDVSEKPYSDEQIKRYREEVALNIKTKIAMMDMLNVLNLGFQAESQLSMVSYTHNDAQFESHLINYVGHQDVSRKLFYQYVLYMNDHDGVGPEVRSQMIEALKQVFSEDFGFKNSGKGKEAFEIAMNREIFGRKRNHFSKEFVSLFPDIVAVFQQIEADHPGFKTPVKQVEKISSNGFVAMVEKETPTTDRAEANKNTQFLSSKDILFSIKERNIDILSDQISTQEQYKKNIEEAQFVSIPELTEILVREALERGVPASQISADRELKEFFQKVEVFTVAGENHKRNLWELNHPTKKMSHQTVWNQYSAEAGVLPWEKFEILLAAEDKTNHSLDEESKSARASKYFYAQVYYPEDLIDVTKKLIAWNNNPENIDKQIYNEITWTRHYDKAGIPHYLALQKVMNKYNLRCKDLALGPNYKGETFVNNVNKIMRYHQQTNIRIDSEQSWMDNAQRAELVSLMHFKISLIHQGVEFVDFIQYLNAAYEVKNLEVFAERINEFNLKNPDRKIQSVAGLEKNYIEAKVPPKVSLFIHSGKFKQFFAQFIDIEEIKSKLTELNQIKDGVHLFNEADLRNNKEFLTQHNLPWPEELLTKLDQEGKRTEFFESITANVHETSAAQLVVTRIIRALELSPYTPEQINDFVQKNEKNPNKSNAWKALTEALNIDQKSQMHRWDEYKAIPDKNSKTAKDLMAKIVAYNRARAEFIKFGLYVHEHEDLGTRSKFKNLVGLDARAKQLFPEETKTEAYRSALLKASSKGVEIFGVNKETEIKKYEMTPKGIAAVVAPAQKSATLKILQNVEKWNTLYPKRKLDSQRRWNKYKDLAGIPNYDQSAGILKASGVDIEKDLGAAPSVYSKPSSMVITLESELRDLILDHNKENPDNKIVVQDDYLRLSGKFGYPSAGTLAKKLGQIDWKYVTGRSDEPAEKLRAKPSEEIVSSLKEFRDLIIRHNRLNSKKQIYSPEDYKRYQPEFGYMTYNALRKKIGGIDWEYVVGNKKRARVKDSGRRDYTAIAIRTESALRTLITEHNKHYSSDRIDNKADYDAIAKTYKYPALRTLEHNLEMIDWDYVSGKTEKSNAQPRIRYTEIRNLNTESALRDLVLKHNANHVEEIISRRQDYKDIASKYGYPSVHTVELNIGSINWEYVTGKIEKPAPVVANNRTYSSKNNPRNNMYSTVIPFISPAWFMEGGIVYRMVESMHDTFVSWKKGLGRFTLKLAHRLGMDAIPNNQEMWREGFDAPKTEPLYALHAEGTDGGKQATGIDPPSTTPEISEPGTDPEIKEPDQRGKVTDTDSEFVRDDDMELKIRKKGKLWSLNDVKTSIEQFNAGVDSYNAKAEEYNQTVPKRNQKRLRTKIDGIRMLESPMAKSLGMPSRQDIGILLQANNKTRHWLFGNVAENYDIKTEVKNYQSEHPNSKPIVYKGTLITADILRERREIYNRNAPKEKKITGFNKSWDQFSASANLPTRVNAEQILAQEGKLESYLFDKVKTFAQLHEAVQKHNQMFEHDPQKQLKTFNAKWDQLIKLSDIGIPSLQVSRIIILMEQKTIAELFDREVTAEDRIKLRHDLVKYADQIEKRRSSIAGYFDGEPMTEKELRQRIAIETQYPQTIKIANEANVTNTENAKHGMVIPMPISEHVIDGNTVRQVVPQTDNAGQNPPKPPMTVVWNKARDGKKSTGNWFVDKWNSFKTTVSNGYQSYVTRQNQDRFKTPAQTLTPDVELGALIGEMKAEGKGAPNLNEQEKARIENLTKQWIASQGSRGRAGLVTVLGQAAMEIPGSTGHFFGALTIAHTFEAAYDTGITPESMLELLKGLPMDAVHNAVMVFGSKLSIYGMDVSHQMLNRVLNIKFTQAYEKSSIKGVQSVKGIDRVLSNVSIKSFVRGNIAMMAATALDLWLFHPEMTGAQIMTQTMTSTLAFAMASFAVKDVALTSAIFAAQRMGILSARTVQALATRGVASLLAVEGGVALAEGSSVLAFTNPIGIVVFAAILIVQAPINRWMAKVQQNSEVWAATYENIFRLEFWLKGQPIPEMRFKDPCVRYGEEEARGKCYADSAISGIQTYGTQMANWPVTAWTQKNMEKQADVVGSHGQYRQLTEAAGHESPWGNGIVVKAGPIGQFEFAQEMEKIWANYNSKAKEKLAEAREVINQDYFQAFSAIQNYQPPRSVDSLEDAGNQVAKDMVELENGLKVIENNINVETQDNNYNTWLRSRTTDKYVFGIKGWNNNVIAPSVSDLNEWAEMAFYTSNRIDKISTKDKTREAVKSYFTTQNRLVVMNEFLTGSSVIHTKEQNHQQNEEGKWVYSFWKDARAYGQWWRIFQMKYDPKAWFAYTGDGKTKALPAYPKMPTNVNDRAQWAAYTKAMNAYTFALENNRGAQEKASIDRDFKLAEKYTYESFSKNTISLILPRGIKKFEQRKEQLLMDLGHYYKCTWSKKVRKNFVESFVNDPRVFENSTSYRKQKAKYFADQQEKMKTATYRLPTDQEWEDYQAEQSKDYETNIPMMFLQVYDQVETAEMFSYEPLVQFKEVVGVTSEMLSQYGSYTSCN